MDNTLQQLMHLRMMTISTGAIHEAQALQLRNYPLLIDGILKSTVKINVDEKTVEYKITECRKSAFKNEKRFKEDTANLKKWIQTLLWPNTTVVMKYDRKVLYDSRRE